jgi:hypothetical protein
MVAELIFRNIGSKFDVPCRGNELLRQHLSAAPCFVGITAAMGCCCLSPEGAHRDGGGKENSTGSQNRLLPDLVFKAVLADERATQEFLKFTQAEFSSENLEFYLARLHVSTCGRSALAPRPRAAAREPLALARCRGVAWRCCCGRGLRRKPQCRRRPGLLARACSCDPGPWLWPGQRADRLVLAAGSCL